MLRRPNTIAALAAAALGATALVATRPDAGAAIAVHASAHGPRPRPSCRRAVTRDA